MRLTIIAALAASLTLAAGRPAHADPFAAALDIAANAHARTGPSAIRSMRMELSQTGGPTLRGVMDIDSGTTQITEVLADGTPGYEMYLTPGMTYSRLSPAARWTRMDVTPTVVKQEVAHLNAQLSPSEREAQRRHDAARKRLDAEPTRVLPDRWVSGVRYGAFQKRIRARSLDSRASENEMVALTCQYVKATGANLACAGGKYRMTMDFDSSLTPAIVIPQEAIHAPLMSL